MKKLPGTGTVEISPSILSADFAHLGKSIADIADHVRMLHLDIMDGHFVPNLTIGPPVVKKLRPICDLFFDTHLMLMDPARYAPEFVKAGSNGITFHLEAVSDPLALIRQLRDLGVSVGISIKPKTPVGRLEGVIEAIDMVLLMTVEPGFGGQALLPDSAERCAAVRKMLRPDQRLEVDGGINPETIGGIVRAGADTIVAGHAIFNTPDPATAIRAMHAAAMAEYKPTGNL